MTIDQTWIPSYASYLASNAGSSISQFGATPVGKGLKRSVLESVGWHYEKLGLSEPSKGFIGLNNAGITDIAAQLPDNKMAQAWASNGFSKAMSNRTSYGTVGSQARQMGQIVSKGRWGLGSFAIAAMGYEAYSGYNSGGIFSGTKGIVGSAENIGTVVGFNFAINTAASMLGVSTWPLVAAAAVAMTAYGTYQLGEAGKRHRKKLEKIELGGGHHILDTINSQGGMTMRQRSLMAIQKTYINSHRAIGNEGYLMHTSYL